MQALLEAFAESECWRAEPAQEVLDLPGIGLCVPDLCFTHQGTGELVFCEVLGFWNRAAVWRRIELVEQGLSSKIVFVVSARLRVSESCWTARIRPHFTCTKARLIPKPCSASSIS